MPRGNAVNLIPWPYRWLAVAALAVALIGFGWVKGAGHVQSKWDAAAQQQTLQAAAIRERQAQATVKVVTQYVDRVRVVNRPGFCRQSRASYFLSNRSPYEQSTLPRRIQGRGGQTNP